MAHIASCYMADAEVVRLSLNSYIAKSPSSPLPSPDTQANHPQKKPFVFRMMQQQPENSRKYQLFPKEKPVAAHQAKGLDPGQAFALAMGQNGEKSDKASGPGGLRLRIMEHNLNLNPVRRRKISVPELSPMTTVHEAAIDSPTIPGRLAFHERSVSAPGHGWRQHHHLANTTSTPEMDNQRFERRNSPIDRAVDGLKSTSPTRQPLSPKDLRPLVIPTQTSAMPRLTRQLSLTRLRSGSTQHEPTIRSARTDDSPRRTPYTPTPLSASQPSYTPRSAASSFATANSSASTMPTPVSAHPDLRDYSRPWTSLSHDDVAETPKETEIEYNHSVPRTATELRAAPNALSHRRNQSESSMCSSIMERGRPKKRGELIGLKRAGSKRSKSSERRAFEELPKGWRAPDAVNMLDPTEAAALQKQALQQTARFEILRKEDVDSLSRELRHLDERTEYLRRTYQSLRAGRRNLHARICQYLRSPRMARFSHDSMLKQEEALAELDNSIDDWVNKLEHADNRRTRVRQKLLEHVAAAATLPLDGRVVASSESLQMPMDVTTPTVSINISTPPRSPATKTAPTPSGSPSPQRVVAQVPSTILEDPIIEEAAAVGLGIEQNAEEPLTAAIRRSAVESIRIYAGDDVYALFAEVETQITRMSRAGGLHTPPMEQVPELPQIKDAKMSDEERVKLHRAHSHELLSRGAPSSASLSTIGTSRNHSPVTSCNASTVDSSRRSDSPLVAETRVEVEEEDDGSGECLMLLTGAVYNPNAGKA